MARPKGQLRLGAFFNPTGHHVASWRHPGAQADAGINFKHYVEIAQTAERGKFDMVFFADNACVREANMEAVSRSAQYIANFEPITLISALAAVTSRIGLTCTASTSFNEPYHVARKFASLDHISGGRAGWNLVTSGMQNGAEAIDALNCQIASSAFASEGAMSCAVPVLYLILRFLEDLAVSGGSYPAQTVEGRGFVGNESHPLRHSTRLRLATCEPKARSWRATAREDALSDVALRR